MSESVVEGLRNLLYSEQVMTEFGGSELAADTVYGVIVEIGYKGTVIIVAGFRDGTSRLYFGQGGGVLGEKKDFPRESLQVAQLLVQTAQSVVPHTVRETSRSFPEQGDVRFVLLTGAGPQSASESIANLETKQSALCPLWGPTNYLMNILLKFMNQRRGAS